MNIKGSCIKISQPFVKLEKLLPLNSAKLLTDQTNVYLTKEYEAMTVAKRADESASKSVRYELRSLRSRNENNIIKGELPSLARSALRKKKGHNKKLPQQQEQDIIEEKYKKNRKRIRDCTDENRDAKCSKSILNINEKTKNEVKPKQLLQKEEKINFTKEQSKVIENEIRDIRVVLKRNRYLEAALNARKRIKQVEEQKLKDNKHAQQQEKKRGKIKDETKNIMMEEKNIKQAENLARSTKRKKPLYLLQIAPPLPTDDCYDSDDDDAPKHILKPYWAQGENLKTIQKVMTHCGENFKNSFFCPQPEYPDLVDLFEIVNPRIMKRTSTAHWKKIPRYTLLALPQF